MNKQKIVWPLYVKNSKGKITHVYVPLDAYESMQKKVKEWERIQKQEGVKWVDCTTAMDDEEILSKKNIKKDVKKSCKKPVKKVVKKVTKKSSKI